MRKYSVTPAAREDLLDIRMFIAARSPQGARTVMSALRAGMRRVGESPGIGHARSDLGDEELRVWIVFTYVIVYRPRMRPIELVRVLHGARDIAELFGPSPG